MIGRGPIFPEAAVAAVTIGPICSSCRPINGSPLAMPNAPSRKSDADAGSSRLHAIANWVCFGVGSACLALGLVRLWQSNMPGAALGLGAGLLLIFAATVERFEL